MSQNLLQLEGMHKLGLITAEELSLFKKSFREGGESALKACIDEYYRKQEEKVQAEEKEISKELRNLIREDKALLNKWKRAAEKTARARAQKRTSNYIKIEKLNEAKFKKLVIEMAAADRKIDEILKETTQKIEAEITQKIREKLA